MTTLLHVAQRVAWALFCLTVLGVTLLAAFDGAVVAP